MHRQLAVREVDSEHVDASVYKLAKHSPIRSRRPNRSYDLRPPHRAYRNLPGPTRKPRAIPVEMANKEAGPSRANQAAWKCGGFRNWRWGLCIVSVPRTFTPWHQLRPAAIGRSAGRPELVSGYILPGHHGTSVRGNTTWAGPLLPERSSTSSVSSSIRDARYRRRGSVMASYGAGRKVRGAFPALGTWQTLAAEHLSN